MHHLALNDYMSLDEGVHLEDLLVEAGGSLCLQIRGVEVVVDLRNRSSEELMNEILMVNKTFT